MKDPHLWKESNVKNAYISELKSFLSTDVLPHYFLPPQHQPYASATKAVSITKQQSVS